MLRCVRILSCMLKVESCLKVVCICRWVDFFHLMWSFFVSGSGECLVVVVRMWVSVIPI